MPFIASDLSALSAANGFTLWHYRTSDSRADTEAPG
jgi:outer membrane protein assembly factor BamB